MLSLHFLSVQFVTPKVEHSTLVLRSLSSLITPHHLPTSKLALTLTFFLN